LSVEYVPALRCGHCGEAYFDIAALKVIEAEHATILEQVPATAAMAHVDFGELRLL
jgi:hypothetical protein